MSKAGNLANFATNITDNNDIVARNVNSYGILVSTGADVSGIITTNSVSVSGILTTNNAIVSGILTTSGLGGVAYAGISTTSSGKVLVNREYCTAVTSVAGTSAGIAITLPASPSPGWEVGVAVGGTFTDTVIRRNGSRIMGLAEDMTLDRAYISVQLVYTDSTVGWRFY